MRIGHASISENGTTKNGVAGDQTKKEVCIREFYEKDWKFLLRCTDLQKANDMAVVCEILCANDCIGYDQNERNTLHNELKKIQYNFAKLEKPCECDCSSFMTAIAECVYINPEYTNGNAPTTSNMVSKFTATGNFISLPYKKGMKLKRGDILVNPGHHTIMVIDDLAAPKSKYKYGLDVSSCQGKIDWKKVKESGIEFACLRSTKKNGTADEYFETNLRELIANKMDYSCYKYSYAKTEEESIAEANSVIKLLNNRKMTIWLDLEHGEQLNTIGKAGVNKIAKAFIATVKNAGYDVGIYCNLNWHNNVLDSELKSKYKLWIARYGNNSGELEEAYKPNVKEFAWQYTSRGRVNGINGDVDLDVM